MENLSYDAVYSLPTPRKENGSNRQKRLSVASSFASTSPSIYSPPLPSYPVDDSDTDTVESVDAKTTQRAEIRREASRPKRSISPPHYDDARNILPSTRDFPSLPANLHPNHSSPDSPSTPTAVLPPTLQHRQSNGPAVSLVASDIESQFDALLDQLCQQTTQILRVSRSILVQASTSRHLVERINSVESPRVDPTPDDSELEERMVELERDCDEWLSPPRGRSGAGVVSRTARERSKERPQPTTAVDSLRFLNKPKAASRLSYLPTPPISPVVSLGISSTASTSQPRSVSPIPSARFDTDFDSSPSHSSNRPFRTTADDQLSPLRPSRDRSVSSRTPAPRYKSDSLQPTLAPTTISASSSFSSLSAFSTLSPSIATPSLASPFFPSASHSTSSTTPTLANRRRPSFTHSSNPSYGHSHSHSNQQDRERDKAEDIYAERAILVSSEQEGEGLKMGLKERLEKARGSEKAVVGKAEEGGRGWFGW